MRVVAASLMLLLWSAIISDALEPIGATATYVQGEVTLHPAKGKESHLVRKGESFTEGDRILTSENGRIEVRFDNNDTIQVSSGSNLLIKALHRTPRGDSFSIFGLSIGRVKSFVAKLSTKLSKFEYQTKAAICGVAGTPPWTVTTTGEMTKVDLEGEVGDEGALYVRGTEGASEEEVILTPNQRTVVHRGQSPITPIGIAPLRLEQLQQPFGDVSEVKHIPPPLAVMMNHMTRKVSIPRRILKGASATLQELETQYDQGNGLTSRSGSADVPSMGQILYHGTAHIGLN